MDYANESKTFALSAPDRSVGFHPPWPPAIAERSLHQPAGQAKFPRARVFLVDDDSGIRKSLTRLLRAAGYEPLPFESAEDFLRTVPADSSGCLISDLCMPGFDGLSLQRELLSRGSELPVIFFTANDDASKAAQAMRNGAVHFLTKPVEAAVLLQAIREALERDRAEGPKSGQIAH